MANLVQHQIQAPQTDAEKRAVKAFGRLRVAEHDYRTVGVAFGETLVALRDEIKAKHGRDFMSLV